MKLADIDWGGVLAALPRWEALSAEAREAFLHLKPGTPAEPSVLGPHAAELVAAAFVVPPGPKGRLYSHAPELRMLLRALRTAYRLHPLDAPGGRLPPEYVQEQLTAEETRALIGPGMSYYATWADRRDAANRVSSVEWVRGFLAAAPGMPKVLWEQKLVVAGERQRFVSPLVAQAAHALVRALAERVGGVPLRTLPELLPGAGPATRVAALAAALRYLLVFVSIGDRDTEAVLGVLPSIALRMGPPPPPPAAVAAAEVFEAPFLVADLTAVLVEAAGEPIPVRGQDGSLFVRSQKAIAPRLLRFPAWVDAFVHDVANHDRDEEAAADRLYDRIGTAAQVLIGLGLAKIGRVAERFQFAATPAGRAWLALGEGERLKRLLDQLRGSGEINPGWHQSSAPGLDFFGVRLSFELGEEVDLRAPLAAAFLSLPADGVVPLAAFLRHHAQCGNPLLDSSAAQPRRAYGTRPATREEWEDLWATLLAGLLKMRLLPLGGARLARTGQGIGFALTGAGRYLLGASDEFRHAAPPDGEVVVQPDFEIVFLAPAPRIEAELARFAERTGTGVGALFRITRASILRAAEAGLAADGVLKALAQASRTPVPANVARQVKDWFGGTRRVRIAPAVLVECPDTETTARVTGVAGAQATPVTRTILRLSGDARSVAGLVKKLRAEGIFVDE
ncbi:MAG TPA: helicase-associated domain-containing protein [Longimicrobium sp.]|nr:helicase-associated domain-containing protein [Longimicrobium sp.]